MLSGAGVSPARLSIRLRFVPATFFFRFAIPVDFILFVLVNLTLFVRPGELIPALLDIPIYNILILAAMAAALPQIISRLNPTRLLNDPISACVLGLLPAVMFSHLCRFDTWSARETALEFGKCIVYYVILISVVNSTERLRMFLYSIGVCSTCTLGVAVLHYYEIIQVPTLTVLQQTTVDEETGDLSTVIRLRATGIFNDPNDVSMIAVVGIVVSLYGISDRRLGGTRLAWVLPLGLFLLAIILTKSRGGFLALLAAAGTFSWLRFGPWITVPGICSLLPAALLLGGRMANIGGAMSKGSADGTGSERVQLWSDGLVLLKGSPVFGIGCGRYSEEVGLVAHNSFVHGFVELGLFGGSLFFGAFLLSVVNLWNLHRGLKTGFGFLTNPTYRSLEPCIVACVCGVAVSIFSLSRNYVTPTYIILGMASIFCDEGRLQGIPGLATVTVRRIGELGLASIGFLIAIRAFIMVVAR